MIPSLLYDVDAIQRIFGIPWYHVCVEVLLMLWILRMAFRRRSAPPRRAEAELSEQEKDELIRDWRPEPLVPPEDQRLRLVERPCMEGKIAKYATVISDSGERYECLNVASYNFLNFVGRADIEEAAVKTMGIYGVGSCGPRGFYGTAEIHLELEKRLAQFLGVEDVALYSYGYATIGSVVPSYSKRGDIIFADEGVSFAAEQGIRASRSHVKYFKHNDTDDLERLLLEQAAVDRQNPKKAKATRRFLIIEGLYGKYGDICPLPALIELKNRFLLRVILDETFSFGTLGALGKGVTDYFGIDIGEIDMMCASLENAIPAGGGFVAGSSFIVEHQRLSGPGYVFSASMPPLLASAALKGLDLIEKDHRIFRQLEKRCRTVHSKLRTLDKLRLDGIADSPIKHLRLHTSEPSANESNYDADWVRRENLLRTVTDWAWRFGGVLLTTASYVSAERLLPEPSIRLSVNCDLSDAEIDRIVMVINKACDILLDRESASPDSAASSDLTTTDSVISSTMSFEH